MWAIGLESDFRRLSLLLSDLFKPFEVNLSEVMGHRHQGNLGFYLLQATQVEAPEAHVVFDVSKTTFYFDTALFFKHCSFLRTQVLPRLLFVVFQLLIDLYGLVLPLFGFATLLIKRTATAVAAFIELDSGSITCTLMRFLIGTPIE